MTGIPAHGGGKRYAEEQRLVSASIRGALKDIDITVLQGHKVAIVFDIVNDEGGGSLNGGRLNIIGALTSGYLMSPLATSSGAFQVFNLVDSGGNYNNSGTSGSGSATTAFLNNGTNSQTGNYTSNGSSTNSQTGSGTNTSSSAGTNASNSSGAFNQTGSGTNTASSSGTNTSSTSGSFNQSGSGTNTGSNSMSGTSTGTSAETGGTSPSNTNTSSSYSQTQNTTGSSTNNSSGTNSSTHNGSFNQATTGSSSNTSAGTNSNTSTGSSNQTATGSSTNASTGSNSSVGAGTNTSNGTTAQTGNSGTDNSFKQNGNQTGGFNNTRQAVSNNPSSTTTQTKGPSRNLSATLDYKGLGDYQNFNVPKSDASLLMGLVRNYLLYSGVQVTTPTDPTADTLLYVTVDVFGIVRSRFDSYVYNQEKLKAETSFEMAAFDRNGRMVMRPRSSNRESQYTEHYLLWAGPFASTERVRKGNGLLVDFSDVDGSKANYNNADISRTFIGGKN